MAFSPLHSISQGVSDTSPINALIDTFNRVLSGLGQSVTALATDPLTPTSTLQDIQGCSVSLSVTGNNAFALAIGTLAVTIVTAESGHNIAGDLDVDGATQSGEIIWPTANLTAFGTPSRSWVVPLAAGNRTLKLRGRNDGTSSSDRIIRPGHTGLTVVLFDIT